ncbi:hypothetical protein [Metarhizobium album]|uniref:hypothetical protein n=1 Tax=Metarhizobium album TaxID=2182425 RepID=UPI001403AD1B|nr:hypothetical protein [Rhizobium album]
MLNGTLPIVGRLEKMRLIGVAVTASLAVLEIARTMPGLADSKLNSKLRCKTSPPSAEAVCPQRLPTVNKPARRMMVLRVAGDALVATACIVHSSMSLHPSRPPCPRSSGLHDRVALRSIKAGPPLPSYDRP